MSKDNGITQRDLEIIDRIIWAFLAAVGCGAFWLAWRIWCFARGRS